MRIAKTLKADKVLTTRAHYAKQKELTEKVKEEQQKVDIIFDRFERFDNKNAAIKEGSGIGLSIVKKLVDALGGKIEIKSEVDKGTTVRLIFKKSNSQNNLEQIYDMQHLEEKVNLEMSDIS